MCVPHSVKLVDCVRCTPVRQVDAWSSVVASQWGPWNLFGGLTFDPRRRPVVPPGCQKMPVAGGSGERLRVGPICGVDRLTGDADPRIRLTSARPMARDVAVAKVRHFFREGQRRLGRELRGIVALEYHQNGWPHFHPLLKVEGGLQGGEVKTLGGLWYAECGGNRLERPRSVGDVTAYAAKYLSKGLDRGDVVIWPERGRLDAPWRRSLM